MPSCKCDFIIGSVTPRLRTEAVMGLLTSQSDMGTLHQESKECSSRGAFACVINTEISAVLAVMRRNVRWGVRYLTDDNQMEHPLIQSLKKLRKEIFSWQNQWDSTNPAAYLQPFLDVIQSDETGAPITGVALSSVYKMLTLDILNIDTVNVEDAMALIVDAVTSCRFEVTDPASEEVVLMKILQVLMACMKSKASKKLSDQHVCNMVNACFRVVHQASSKGELLQRIARHTMHEMVRCIFSCLHDIAIEEHTHKDGQLSTSDEAGSSNRLHLSDNQNLGDVTNNRELGGGDVSNASTGKAEPKVDNGVQMEDASNEEQLMTKPFGIPCMVEIFHFLCSLLNVIENIESGPRSNPIAYEEDVPLFSLGLINSAIELGGAFFARHPKLLLLIQDELFQNLMQFGLSMSPLILSTVCSIVLNLYHHMRTELKLQLEAFFSFVLLRLAHNKHGYSFQQQEVAMEAIVDLCRQPSFVTEIYANYDCDITCNNVFEDISNLLSKSAFPVNSPLSVVNLLALDGLIAIVQGMANRVGDENPSAEQVLVNSEGYESFWTVKCESYHDLDLWIPFVRKMKYIKRRLMVGADHFNRDSKKGLQFLQEMHLLPEKLDPQSVAYFFRYTISLDKNVVGDFLGNHDDFCVQVLQEFAKTFDFEGMSLDGALRLFLGTFRLPGESQKIQRVLEAFAERYYEQCPHILSNKDAALLLSYSIIMLNTDQHNAQVKRKMTEEDFIRNNRCINAGKDLPRDFLSELYHSISENEIQMLPDQGSGLPVMTSSRWVSLLQNSKKCGQFILCDSTARLDYDMFTILSGPSIAAISVVIDNMEHEEVIQTCINGFMNIAKISACYHLNDILDDLVVSLCKFTTLLDPSSAEESILALVEDIKARMATTFVFAIANKYGDCVRTGWKNIVDCVLYLHKLRLLRLADGTAENGKSSSDTEIAPAIRSQSAPPVLTSSSSRKSSGLMGRFSQLFSFEAEEPIQQSTLEELESHQQALLIIQSCQIGSIFMESKFLQADSLLQLVQALILAAGRLQKGPYSPEDEDTAVFCLGLLIEITVNNRDRIMLLWQSVYEHIANVVQSTVMPCTLVEKAVFGLLQICQRLLPYKENLTDELLRSLRLVLKLDARVADAYCEHITQEVMHLVKGNAPQIRSHVGWRTIISLLSITAQHPEASEVGFETLVYIMSDAAHLSPANYVLCVDAARQFAESRVGKIDRSVRALDLMADSFVCLIRWSNEAKQAVGDEAAAKVHQDIGEMWMRLVQGLKRLGLDRREQVRNHAILVLQRSLIGAEGIYLPQELWLQCFDTVIFALLDDLLNVGQGSSVKDYRNMEGTFVLAVKLLSKVFLQLLQDDSAQKYLTSLWEGYLNRMESFMKAKFRGRWSENVHEVVPELLKNTLLIMKAKGILVASDAAASTGKDSLWQLTWSHVKQIAPSLQTEIFSNQEAEQMQNNEIKTGSMTPSDGAVLVPTTNEIKA